MAKKQPKNKVSVSKKGNKWLVKKIKKDKTLPDPVVEFNVFPGMVSYSNKEGSSRVGRRGFYFTCKVFDTHRDLNRYLKMTGTSFSGPGGGSEAACKAFSNLKVIPGRKPYYTSQLGELCFYKKSICSEVISHECTHAVMRWLYASRQMKDFSKLLDGYVSDTYRGVGVGEEEEVLCYAIGSMTWQVQYGSTKRGLKLYE